jgi:hypothetical protein
MVWARRTLLKAGRRTRRIPSGAHVYNISTRTREASERGLQHHHHMMVVTGSESGLFVATVTTGAMAAMAAATVGFYTHEAVARLLLLVGPDNHNNAGNARVEGRLSKMEQSMQQQQERETSVLNRMSVSLDVTNAKLGHLDKALKRALLLLPPPRSSLATATATRRRALRV